MGNTLVEKIDEFYKYCFTHGHTLRNHMAFGEMYRDLKKSAEAQVAIVFTCANCSTLNELSEGLLVLDSERKLTCHQCGKDTILQLKSAQQGVHPTWGSRQS